MQGDHDIRQLIERLQVRASSELDTRVLDAIHQAGQADSLATSSDEPSLLALITMMMKKKSIRYTIGTTLGLAVIIGVTLNQTTTTGWAMGQAIAALQNYRAVRMTGYAMAGGAPAPTEIWARANSTGTRSDECLVRSDKFTAWVEDNKTYVYDHSSNKVIVDSAITMGMDPWLGPRLLTTLEKMPDYKAIQGDNPATGQKKIIVTASIESAAGPQSFAIEFDAETKLPVSMTHWQNVGRQGPPDFAFNEIVYFEDLPDESLSFDPPAGVLFETKPLAVPDANIQMLRDPESGIRLNGLNREAACREILRQFWDAVINDDLDTIRRLCPLTTKWPDRLLLDVIAEDRVVELLEIGGIQQEGQSRLGRLALVPSRVRCQDGKVREIKIILQFLGVDQERACVIHGNYGYSVVVE